ncbi:MAG: hypothetical protein QM808_10595 [Steroidobacteraceae bacterium]
MQIRLMIGISCIASMLLAGRAGAAERAVEVSNFDISLAGAYAQRKHTDSTSNTGLFGGRFAFPLGEFFGARVDAGYSQADLNNVGSNFAEDSVIKTTSAGLGLFYRDPDVLSITLSYARDRDKVSTSGSTGIPYVASAKEYAIDSRTLGATVEGYVRQVTLTAGWNALKYEDGGGKFESASLGARWYLTSDVSLAAGASVQLGSDVNDELYSTGIEFQPAFFKRRAGLAFNYAWRDNSSGVVATLKYYFGNPVDLITRDRHYR